MSHETIEEGRFAAPSQAEFESKSKLTEEAFAPVQPAVKAYIEDESTRVAELLNHAGRFGNAGTDMVRPAAVELSAALKHLSGEDYNKLLLSTEQKNVQYANSPNCDHQFMGALSLSGWNESTSTWDNVTLTARQAGYPMKPEIRIVQPGNTMWGIANDRLSEPSVNDNRNLGVRNMVQEIASLNGISNPAKIEVGDALTLPMQQNQ